MYTDPSRSTSRCECERCTEFLLISFESFEKFKKRSPENRTRKFFLLTFFSFGKIYKQKDVDIFSFFFFFLSFFFSFFFSFFSSFFFSFLFFFLSSFPLSPFFSFLLISKISSHRIDWGFDFHDD